MSSGKTIFDAAEAFRNLIHREATRLSTIIVTGSGDDSDEPIGFVTPWDILHNPSLMEDVRTSGAEPLPKRRRNECRPLQRSARNQD